jgi:hypothetical protein
MGSNLLNSAAGVMKPEELKTESINSSPSPPKEIPKVGAAHGTIITNDAKTNKYGAIPAELHKDEAILPLNDPKAFQYFSKFFESKSLNHNYGKLNEDLLKSLEAISMKLSTIIEEPQTKQINKNQSSESIKTKLDSSNNTTIVQPIITNNTTNSSINRQSTSEVSSKIHKIIETLFPNTVISFETAMTTFALGQSPFAVSR